MRTLLLLICLLFLTNGYYSQTNSGNQLKYFAQIKLNTSDTEILNEIETTLKANPNCFVVRLDRITNGLLIVTNELNSFDEVTMNSWLEGNENVVECYNIGIQGYDDHFAFDDDFCNNVNQ